MDEGESMEVQETGQVDQCHVIDEETLLNPLLTQLGLVINPKHKFLICRECQSVIEPAKVRAHFQHAHKDVSIPSKIEQTLALSLGHHFKKLYFPQNPPLQPIPPIKHLPIMEGYHGCPNCNRCYQSQEGFRKHKCPHTKTHSRPMHCQQIGRAHV